MAHDGTVPGGTDADLVVRFLNTIDVGSGWDALSDRDALATWLVAHGLTGHGLPGGRPAPATARRVRRALRESVDGRQPLPTAMHGVRLRLEFGPSGVPRLGADDPIGLVLAAVARLVTTDEWRRIKLCSEPTCRYAFHDRSRNRSARWCDMRVCGNRAKTRTFRERHRS